MAVKGACALFFLFAFHFSVQAQILAWEFNTNTGSEVTVNAGTNNANLNTAVISRGAGITATGLTNAYSSTGFTVSGTLADAKTNNKYLQFTVNSKSGYKVSLSTLDFNFRRSSTGPNAFQWQYSLDGFTTAGVDLGAVISYTTSPTAGDAQPQISLSGITSLQNLPSTTTVTFRLFAYGATATTGTFALGRPTTPLNDLSVGGTVAVSGAVDTTAPTVSTYSPLNSSVNSNLSLSPSLNFSENIQKGTGNITINNLTDATNQVIDVTNSSVTINNSLLSIGGATFINGKSYAIQIAAGAIKDLATTPNDFAGITNNTTWAFSFNANPTATNDAFTVYKNEVFNGNVATNDSDPNSTSLTFSKLTDPALGSLTFNTNGTFSYTPQSNYTGTQSFTYRVTNSANYSSDATVTLNVNERTTIIISQYYEGTGVNKWIELTNTGTSPVNTASPQLQLALYNVSGDVGNITFTNAYTPSQKMNLTITIPAKGSVVIGNQGNGTEVPYVSVASANQNDANVINFNGNDGIALLDANNQIIDAFGQGINAKDVSYERNQNVTTTSDTFIPTDWTQLTLIQVQEADDTNNPIRLGVHIPVVYTACAAPVAPATQLVFSNVNFTSIDLNFTASNATDEYLIIRSTQATLGASPVNGTTYNVGDALGNGSVIGRISSTSFSNTGLSYGTTYYYFIYSLNNGTCTGGPLYQSSSLNGSQSTNTPPVCAAPTNQPTNFSIGLYNYNFIQGSYTTTTADEYLVVMSTSSTLSATPVNGTVYSVNQPFGGGVIIKRGTGNTFTKTGLTASTPYYFTIYALNSTCTGGPVYQTVNPLLGNQTTMAQNSGALNNYFGNLH
ncbi:MAG: Ig-like domain-containing protein, partial [Burkholderiales bacterium]|nr:Ig-like domain-containing protein [Bacteroidia bacterium]